MDDDDLASTSLQMAPPKKKKFFPIQSGDIPPQIYINNRPHLYSHMSSRMMGEDFVAREMFNAGPKGIDRIRIAEKMGIDARTKTGSRKVSKFIQNLTRGLPNEAGTYQKLVGKVRIHNFYHKTFKPNAFADLMKSISDLIGRPCPMEIGDVMEFPNKKLTRMRITDVTVKRMLIILTEVYQNEVVLLRNIYKIINESESSEGSEFIIDRKSLLKVYSALQHHGLLEVHIVKVIEDETENECDLVLLCSPDVHDPTDRRIRQAIVDAQQQYHDQGRIFPGGQVKRRETKKVSRPSLKKSTVPKLVKQDPPVVVPPPEPVKAPSGPKAAPMNYSQKKMVKLHLLHSYLYRLAYHPFIGRDDVPTYSDRFPLDVNQRVEETPAEEMFVFDEPQDSLFRFVPPMPPENAPQGWFVLKYIIRAMPLSIYALVNDMELDEVFDYYLNDPEKRHMMLYDLPLELRKRAMNKKTVLNIDVQCLQLCGLGLMVAASDKGAVGDISMYYVRPTATIFDTSTAQKSFGYLHESFDFFQRYDYNFESLNDISMFWYHLRAISLSTPMNIRNVREKDTYKINARKFSKEAYTKESYSAPSLEDVDWTSPELPGKGAGGVDPALFIHYKRNWDLVSLKKPFSEWFTSHYKEEGEMCRADVESRVDKLNKFWFSLMQAMTNEPLFKKRPGSKKSADALEEEEPTPKRSRVLNIKPIGKRLPDLEDIEAVRKSHLMRNRFSQDERDMMVLMRAVGQFLNPTSKLWIDPIVMRRIMKAYLEESFSKTILSLLAASCREANIPSRQADIWHLVRGLGSFTQMCNIRNQMAIVLNEDFETKAEYFCQAFDIAYRLVTYDIPRLPSPLVKDSVLYGILDQNNLTISGGQECVASTSVVSAPPTNLNEIEEAVMYNCVMNVLLNVGNNINDKIVPATFDQKKLANFHQTLQNMMIDGIAVKARSDYESSMKFRQQHSVSLNFCYYFSHTYRSDLFEILENLPDEFIENLETYSDNLASFLRIAYSLTDMDSHFDIDIGMDAFPNIANDSQNRKFQRITESGALRLAAIPISIDSSHMIKPVVEHVCHSYTSQAMPTVNNIEFYASDETLKTFCDALNDSERNATLQIIQSLKDASFHGRTIFELKSFCFKEKMSEEATYNLIKCLENAYMIFACGVDTLRYVHITQALHWGLNINGKALFLKPWTNDNGTVDYSTFRWMAEMVFATINESPDMTLTNLKSYFSNIIHPVFVDDIVEFFIRMKLIEVEVEEVKTIKYTNPFLKEEISELETNLRAAYNGLDLFALIFEKIEIPDCARQKQHNSQHDSNLPIETFEEENYEETVNDSSMF